MPTYELRCKECDHRFDVFVMRMLRNDDCLCPECGSREVIRGVGGGFGMAGVRSERADYTSCGSGGFG